MAKLNGVTIKNLKEFKGHEGEPLYQGDIYVDGKKICEWSQDYSGGICDNFNGFVKNGKYVVPNLTELKKRAADCKAGFPEMSRHLDTEMFLCLVVGLIQIEKKYKKGLKKGYPFTGVYYNDFYKIVMNFASNDASVLETARKRAKKEIGEGFSEYVLSSPSDFELTIDAAHSGDYKYLF